MSETHGTLFFVGKIVLMLFLCSALTLVFGMFSIVYIFGIGDCVLGSCQSTTPGNIAASLALLSPFLIFSIGALFCRSDIKVLTRSRLLRVFMILSFALFPVYILAGLIFYTAVSLQI